jgi:hypothetical protein
MRYQWILGIERSLGRLLVAAILGMVAVSLAACANTPIGEQVERSLAADPRLTRDGQLSSPSSDSGSANTSDSQPSESSQPDRPSSILPATDLPAIDLIAQQLGRRLESSLLPSDSEADSGTFQFEDVTEAPQDLQPYVLDLAALGILTSADASADAPALDGNVSEEMPDSSSSPAIAAGDTELGSETGNAEANRGETSNTETDRAAVGSEGLFNPNQPIRRRDFARWLLAANNQLFGDRPGQRLRLGSADQPAFQDVPLSDPDFAIIQGLAEAGIIASPLSGQATQVNFRPDAPLTRETVLRWKVPLDYRQPLPVASVAAVEETWGFQDATQIDPDSLPAVLADYQNGDASNIRRAFGYTTLLQPKRLVTRAEAAAIVWYFGYQGDGRSARQILSAQSVASAESSPTTLGTRLGTAIAPEAGL